MRTVFVALFLFVSIHAGAEPTTDVKRTHLRFWRGFVNIGADEQRLKDRLNRELLPETVRVGAGKGLTAYLPALFPENRARALPVEIALVAYASQQDYDAIRATPEGKAYGDLHFVEGMFEKKTQDGYISKSEVSRPFAGEVVLPVTEGEAQVEAVVYGISADQIAWQEGFAFLQTLEPKGETDDAAIAGNASKYLNRLERFRAAGRLRAAVVLVNRKYVLSLLSFENEGQTRDYSRSSLFVPEGFSSTYGFAQDTKSISLEAKRLLNFQFDTTIGR